MANESDANFVIDFTPPTTLEHNQAYENFVRLYQKLSAFYADDAYYGISRETYLDALEAPLNEPISSYGTGRWSWSGSMESNYNRPVEAILEKPLILTAFPSYHALNVVSDTTFNVHDVTSLYQALFDTVPTSDLMLDVIDVINQHISETVSAFKNAIKDFQDEIQIFKMNYTDYESGASFLETGGTATLAYHPKLSSFDFVVEEGDITDEPGRVLLAEYEYIDPDSTSENILEELFDNVQDKLSQLSDEVKKSVIDAISEPLTNVLEINPYYDVNDGYVTEELIDELTNEDSTQLAGIDQINIDDQSFADIFPQIIDQVIKNNDQN